MAVNSTWALCPPQAGQRSFHHPLVRLPPASVLPASFPVAIVACHVSAGSRCSALSFNKSSYVLEGRWRVQTTITTGTLHQRVIWPSQAHWQTSLWLGAEAECCVSDRGRPGIGDRKRSRLYKGKSLNVQRKELNNKIKWAGKSMISKTLWMTKGNTGRFLVFFVHVHLTSCTVKALHVHTIWLLLLVHPTVYSTTHHSDYGMI